MPKAKKPRKPPKRVIAPPRTRLAGAMKRLGRAMARDPHEVGRAMREFLADFHDYSRLNRFLIFIQRPGATFLRGRVQWEKLGRKVNKGVVGVRIQVPSLAMSDRGPARRFHLAKVYDVADTTGPAFRVPGYHQDRPAQRELVARLVQQLENWITGSGLELLNGSPYPNELVYGATDGLRVWVQPGLCGLERAAVLAHEIAHVKLHYRVRERGNVVIVEQPNAQVSDKQRELEAELTAFLILEGAGVDSADGAGGYLRTWNASFTAVEAFTETALATAGSVLGQCQTGRYRNVRRPKTPAETRSATAGRPWNARACA